MCHIGNIKKKRVISSKEHNSLMIYYKETEMEEMAGEERICWIWWNTPVSLAGCKGRLARPNPKAILGEKARCDLINQGSVICLSESRHLLPSLVTLVCILKLT